MRDFFRNHPLALVLLLALVIRIPAVIYSKGYMASDDHYETVGVAYNWLQTGLWDNQGNLAWHGNPGIATARFPLYDLFLFAIMKSYHAAGVTSLDTMMYGVRAIQALLSLLSVWGAFKLAEIATNSRKWGMIAGLAVAAQFAMPYLGVRNLIEMVSGHFWLLSLVFLYAYQFREQKTSYLLLAGLLTGLAWMIRFEIAAAAVIVPFVIWYQQKSIKPAIWYSVGVAIMLTLSGLMDWMLLGRFASSTINHIAQINAESAMYETTPLIYPLLLLGLLVPPFSFLGTYLSFRNGFWRRHLMLIATIICFVIIHTIQESRQERYIVPMLVPALLTVILALAWDRENNGVTKRKPWVLKACLIPAIIVNLALLPLLTLNYSKKAEVEPLVQLEKLGGSGLMLMFAPDAGRIFPLNYSGFKTRDHMYVNQWSDLDQYRTLEFPRDQIRYFILYPPDSSRLPQYVDSVQAVFGKVTEWRYIPPSILDWTVHKLNPAHNRSNGAWIYLAEKR